MADKPKFKLVGLSLDRVDLVTAGANPGASVLIHKFDVPDIVEVEEMADPTVETPDVPVEKDENDVSDKVETVAKADFEALQKQLADEAEARKVEVAKAAALEERINKMELERRQAEFVAKARDLSNLGAAADLGLMLLEAQDGMSDASFQLLERTLKAANAQVERGALFAQFSQPDGEAAPVMDRITDLAKAKVAAGEARTIEIAKQMVIKENPALRDEYVAARSGR